MEFLFFFWEDSNTLAFEIGVVSVILPVLEVLLQDKTTRQILSSVIHERTNEPNVLRSPELSFIAQPTSRFTAFLRVPSLTN